MSNKNLSGYLRAVALSKPIKFRPHTPFIAALNSLYVVLQSTGEDDENKQRVLMKIARLIDIYIDLYRHESED